jgi:hypothetical protein
MEINPNLGEELDNHMQDNGGGDSSPERHETLLK